MWHGCELQWRITHQTITEISSTHSSCSHSCSASYFLTHSWLPKWLSWASSKHGSLKQDSSQVGFPTWKLSPLKLSIPRDPGRNCNASCDLPSKVPEHHFHCILSIKQVTQARKGRGIRFYFLPGRVAFVYEKGNNWWGPSLETLWYNRPLNGLKNC